MRYWTTLLLMLLVVAPRLVVAASSGPEVEVAVRSGIQSDVLVSGSVAVFSDLADSSGSPQIWSYDLTNGVAGPIWSTKFEQGSPAIWGTVVAYLEYRSDAPAIWIRDLAGGDASQMVGNPYIPSQVAIADRLIAWRNEPKNDVPRVWVLDERNNQSQPVGGTGSQSSPAAAERQVVLLSDADESVWRYDADTKELTQIFAGPAAAPEIDAEHIVFVDKTVAGGDLALVTLDGARVATLELPGEQARPRVSGKWVAFQDLNVGAGRLAVWNWTTGQVVYPAPENAAQIGSDLDYPWIAYVDTRSDQGDVYAQKLDLDNGGVGTASCDDASAVPLAVLIVKAEPGTTDGDHDHHHHHCHESDPCDPANPQIIEASGETPFQIDQAMRVLVCIDSDGVQAGWVSLNDSQLVGSDELGPTVEHLEKRAQAQQGDNLIEAWIEGYCDATLTVRVLADPDPGTGGTGGTDPDPDACGDDCHHPGLRRCGCGSDGSAGIWVLAGLALLWARRVRTT